MALILDIISWICLMLGVFLGFSGAIGTLRFPDFYSRIHASSVTDTLCAAMIILGLVLQAGFTLITVKLILILLFLWYTSPAASHALVRAAYHTGLTPFLKPTLKSASNKNEQENTSSKP